MILRLCYKPRNLSKANVTQSTLILAVLKTLPRKVTSPNFPTRTCDVGHYGSFLQDEWDLIRAMVSMLDKNLSIPVTCKIRIFPDLARTLAYAKMLEEAGCQLLAVHGRTREQRGQNTGLADWSYIKAIKESVNIPVIANGNILYHEDIKQCMDATGAEGVMTAEGHLHNPMIFRDQSAPIWKMVDEYLEISKEHKTPLSLVRGHLFKLYRPAIHLNQDLRNQIGTAHKSEELVDICAEFNERLRKDAAAHAANPASCATDSAIAHWICQPYVRALADGFSEAPPKACGYCSEQLAAKACQYDGCGTCCATKNSDCSAHRSTDDSSKRARIMAEPVPA